jgi:hypothetical protein
MNPLLQAEMRAFAFKDFDFAERLNVLITALTQRKPMKVLPLPAGMLSLTAVRR